MSWVFANGPKDQGSIPGRVIPKTQKMVLDAALLYTQHYKVRIKSEVVQFSERSRSYRKGSFRVTVDYSRQLYLLTHSLMLKQDSVLNNQQWLICHKTKNFIAINMTYLVIFCDFKCYFYGKKSFLYVLWKPYPSHHNGLFSPLLVLRDFVPTEQYRSYPK